VDTPSSQRNLAARELFAPLATTYDRYARIVISNKAVT